MNKVIWSLFDGSGLMVKPWAEAGYQCYCFNWSMGNHGDYEDMRVQHPNIYYCDAFIDSESWSPMLEIGGAYLPYPEPDLIFSFPDCTFMAQSGSQHERTEKQVRDAVSMARVAMVLGDRYGCRWMVENPRGSLSTHWRKPDYYFDPYQYGGYMTGEEKSFHPRMPSFDGYTKKTGIWCGNGFVMPGKKPGPVNIGCFWGWKYLGGDSTRTKQLRSLTPRGFAAAVYEANK